MATQRRIKVNEQNKVTIVTFNDSKIIDEAEIQEFGQELYDLVEREGRKKIILNFGNVEFLSSAASASSSASTSASSSTAPS